MNYTDEDLLKYSENRLDPERTKRLLEIAEQDLELREALTAIKASRMPFKVAYAQENVPPVPDALKKQVRDWVQVSNLEAEESAQSQSRNQSQRVRKSVAVASVLLSFVGGYIASTLVHKDKAERVASTQQSSQSPLQLANDTGNAQFLSADEAWVKRVADYQSLYVANTVKSILNTSMGAEELLAAITLETGMQTGIPDLSAHGYQFVRAQELGYEGDTLVQLVYFKEGKVPLALCYMLVNSNVSSSPAVLLHSGLGVAHWRGSGQRFVIVADETQEVLGRLYSDAQSQWM